MKILVIGGMHGNEPLGIELVKKLREAPLQGVTAIIANDKAVEKNVRFTDNDLNRSFPGNKKGSSYETTRANEIISLCGSYDIVLDFHNTYCPDNDCSFLGEGASERLFATSSYLGLKRVIVADYDCLNKYALNCLSVEVSMDSVENDATIWYGKIKKLQQETQLPKPEAIDTYKFVYRMTIEDRDRLELDTLRLRAFNTLSDEIASNLGVNSPAYPIFIGDTFTPYNFGGVLNRVDRKITL